MLWLMGRFRVGCEGWILSSGVPTTISDNKQITLPTHLFGFRLNLLMLLTAPSCCITSVLHIKLSTDTDEVEQPPTDVRWTIFPIQAVTLYPDVLWTVWEGQNVKLIWEIKNQIQYKESEGAVCGYSKATELLGSNHHKVS
jgi:hypothetical protein